MEFCIGMRSECERGQTTVPGFYSELFTQLTNQALFGCFAGLDLSAGELPQTGHGLSLWSLGQKNPSVGVNQSHRRDKNDLHDR